MQHEPPESDDARAEYDSAHADSVLGYGGIVLGADGVPRPMPEHEALAAAIPRWVELADHEADTLGACLDVAAHDHPAVRAAAVAAFGELARRYGRLAERARVVRAIELGLRDRDDGVRGAATRSAAIVEQTLGWRISRPVV
jgi:hypothetical protein